MMNDAYIVLGGIFADFTFTKLDPNTDIESHGLFWSYEDAYAAWKKNVWLNVDNALHRLSIQKVEFVPDNELD